MSLDLTAGPPGEDGTVTTGVEKVCTDVHTGDDWPGDFTWPAFDFPPIDPGDPIDFELSDFGGGLRLSGGQLEALPIIYCDSDAYSDAFPIEADNGWEISGTLTLTSASQRLTIGVTSADGTYELTIAGAGYYDGISAPPLRYEMATPDAVRSMVGPTPLNTEMTWLLRWTDTNKILQCQIEMLDFVVDDFKSYPAATMASAETTSSVDGSPTRAGETIGHNCTSEPPPPPSGGCFAPDGPDWDENGYSVAFGPGAVDFNDGSEGPEVILIDPAVITETNEIVWTVHVEFSGCGDGITDAPISSFITQQTTAPFDFAGVQPNWNSVTNEGFIDLFSYTDFSEQLVTDTDICNGFDLVLTISPDLNTVSYSFDGGGGPITDSIPYNVVGEGDQQLKLGFASASAMTMSATANDICIDNTILLAADWVEDSFSGNHTFADGSDHVSTQGAAHNTSVHRGLGDAWTLTGVISPSTVNSTQIGMGVDGLSFEYYLLIYATSEGGGLEVGSLADTTFDATDLSGSATVSVILDYDGIDTLTATFDGGGGPIVIATTTDDIGFPPAVPLYVGVRCYTTAAGGGDFDTLVLV